MACAYVQPSLPWKAIVSVAFLLGVPIKFWNGQPRETSSLKHSHVSDVRRNAPISLLFRAIVHRVSRFPNNGRFSLWLASWKFSVSYTYYTHSSFTGQRYHFSFQSQTQARTGKSKGSLQETTPKCALKWRNWVHYPSSFWNKMG